MKLLEPYITTVTRNSFLNAAKKGKLDILEWLFQKQKGSLHEILEEACEEACANGQLEVVKMLLSRGEIDLRHSIVYACKSDSIELVKMLLDRGVVFNKKYYPERDDYKVEFTPFMMAVNNSRMKTVQLLLERGVTVSKEAFQRIIFTANEEVLSMVLNHGVKV